MRSFKLGLSKTSALIAAVGGLLNASPAPAAVTISITQVGSNVVATASGTLDVTGLSLVYGSIEGGIGLNAGVRGNRVFVGFGNGGQVYEYEGLTGPASIGPGTTYYYDVTLTGTPFGLGLHQFGDTITPAVTVDPSFVSGGTIAATATFAGKTLARLGLKGGQYVYVSPNDRVTIEVGNTGVPEPATWAMMLTGIGLVGYGLRRRRRLFAALSAI